MAFHGTHLFLTGEKGIGKSTLLHRLLLGFSGTIGGFRTVRVPGPQGFQVHLLPAGSKEGPSPENLLFLCGDRGPETTARFDRMGPPLLRSSPGVSLLVMDELGPHEGNALHFRAAVMAALEGPIPILGVLQEDPSPFLSAVASHPAVQVVRVTRQNRDALIQQLRERWPPLSEAAGSGRHCTDASRQTGGISE